MSDPHVSPKGETPMQRRERLMNLTNESWIAPPPNPEAEEEPEEPMTPETVVVEPTTETVSKAKK